jgi:hypothetical protein
LQVAPEQERVLKSLNAFKAMAKQALLAAGTTKDPEYWQRHAESRRQIYKDLITWVETDGVEAACSRALQEYRHALQGKESLPEQAGRLEALESFLSLCGFDERTIKQSQRSIY